MRKRKPIIICAAIRVFGTDEVYKGHRHHYALQAAIDNNLASKAYRLGFITSEDKFVSPADAMIIAVDAGQIEPQKHLDLECKDLHR